MKKKRKQIKTIPLEERITHLFNELRIVLPGTQAILGFQFASVFTDEFQKIPQYLRVIHFVSLCFVLLAIIFLLAAPAYNRIVQPNKATESFHMFAGRVVLLALLFLSIGMSLEMYVVGMIVTSSSYISLALSLISFLLSVSLWFGYSWYSREKIR